MTVHWDNPDYLREYVRARVVQRSRMSGTYHRSQLSKLNEEIRVAQARLASLEKSFSQSSPGQTN